MSAQSSVEASLVQELAAKFGEAIKSPSFKANRFRATVDRDIFLKVAEYLRDTMGFDHVASVCGVDYPKDGVIEVVYHLSSYSREDRRRLVGAVAVRLPRDAPQMPTLTGVWPSAEFHERETYEMLGVIFEGHHSLKKLLLPDDWSDIPPLRKDFALPGR